MESFEVGLASINHVPGSWIKLIQDVLKKNNTLLLKMFVLFHLVSLQIDV